MRWSPAPVEALRNLPPVVSVTAGYKFCTALNGFTIQHYLCHQLFEKLKSTFTTGVKEIMVSLEMDIQEA